MYMTRNALKMACQKCIIHQSFGRLSDTIARETNLVLIGYLLHVMSLLGPVGFGTLQNNLSLQGVYLRYTINQLEETVSCY